jgi:F-type H+-transporting ATPase subunit delta
MSDVTVAKRYAKALFEIAKEQNNIPQVEQDLRTVVTVIKENGDVQKLLLHPNIDKAAKTNLLKQLFEGKVVDSVLSTLLLLIDRGREEILPHLLADYIKISNEALGQATAIVYTPFALSESEAQNVAAHFGKLTGKTIRVENVIDPSLLGGMQVRIGDRLYDGSLSGKLNRLEKTLSQTQAL